MKTTPTPHPPPADAPTSPPPLTPHPPTRPPQVIYTAGSVNVQTKAVTESAEEAAAAATSWSSRATDASALSSTLGVAVEAFEPVPTIAVSIAQINRPLARLPPPYTLRPPRNPFSSPDPYPHPRAGGEVPCAAAAPLAGSPSLAAAFRPHRTVLS